MFVLANSEHVRVPPSWLQMLGTAKLVGGLGLMLGLLGGRPVGLLASIGLILFFLGGGSPPHPDLCVLQHRVPRDVPSALDCLRRALLSI